MSSLRTEFPVPTHNSPRPMANDETYLLLIFILIGGTLIFGCACYSLRITRIRVEKSTHQGVRRSQIQSYMDDEPSSSHRMEISDDLSSCGTHNNPNATSL